MKKTSASGNIRAVIFDMDGVISDTQKIFAKIETEQLAKYGIQVDPEEHSKKYAGVSDRVMYPEIFEKHNIPLPDLQELIRIKWEIMKNLDEKHVVAIPGVLTFIKNLKKHGYLLAVASASLKNFIEKVLQALKIETMFDAIASTEEVRYGKPAPDVFLLAAKKLGIEPKNCLVIEDGINGMLGAKSAGMKCIGLVKNKTKEYPADMLIQNFEEINIPQIHTI